MNNYKMTTEAVEEIRKSYASWNYTVSDAQEYIQQTFNAFGDIIAEELERIANIEIDEFTAEIEQWLIGMGIEGDAAELAENIQRAIRNVCQ